MHKAAIRLEEVTQVFPTCRAVDDLSFEVPPGLIFGFLGPNGAGKTTTIRVLLGLLEPTSGRVEVLGFPPGTRGHEVRSRVGAVLERPGLYDHLTAEENLEFHARASCLPASERGARIRELLTQVGHWERRNDRVGKWSTGMRQRLALARAPLHRPPLLLLDEPTGQLEAAAEFMGDRLHVRLRNAGDVPRLVRLLVETGVEVEEGIVPPGVDAFDVDDIRRNLGEARELFEGGRMHPLLLIAWSSFEAALRLAIESKGIVPKLLTPSHLMKLAVAEGVMSRDDYRITAEIMSQRNALAHGYREPEVSSDSVRQLIDISERLLDEMSSPTSV